MPDIDPSVSERSTTTMSKLATLKKAVAARLTADGQLSDRLDQIEVRRRLDGVTPSDLTFIDTEFAKLDLFATLIESDEGPLFTSDAPYGDFDAAKDSIKLADEPGRCRIYRLVPAE